MTDTLIIRGAHVFDGTAFIGNRVIECADGVITKISDNDGASGSSRSARVVDASGMTLTPGIIDCHVHVGISEAGSLDSFTDPFSLQFYRAVHNMKLTLHAGVTSARDAGGADAGLKTARDMGYVTGPKLTTAISVMSQTGGHGDGCMASGVEMPMLSAHPGRPAGIADGVDSVRTKAREILRAGADHIKVTSTGGVLSPNDDPRHAQYTAEEIEAIVYEAQAQGSYVMSHAIGTAGIKSALRAGVRSIEHGIMLDDEAIDLFLEHGAFLVPTLQAPRAVIKAAAAGASIPGPIVEKAKMVAERHAESIATAYERGVRIAMGTDAGVGPHGENLEELENMTEIGMTPADVLRASTSAGADLMSNDSVGRISVGAAADFALFAGNLEERGLSTARQDIMHVFQDGVQVR